LTITTRRQFSSNSYGEVSYIISSQRSLLEGVFSWKLWRRLSERRYFISFVCSYTDMTA
jgi:hypothetical protein